MVNGQHEVAPAGGPRDGPSGCGHQIQTGDVSTGNSDDAHSLATESTDDAHPWRPLTVAMLKILGQSSPFV
jgi:hypothetical protein